MGWRKFFRRAAWDDERAREIEAHLDHHVDDLVARGMAPDEARREARRKFGNVTSVREEIYDMNSIPVVETVLRELRFAARVLRKSPGFTAAAVLILGIGIGANTAIFSLVDALLLRDLAYPEPDRLGLVTTEHRSPDGSSSQLAQDGRTWELLSDAAPSFDAAVFSDWTGGVNVVAGERAIYAQQQRVGAGFFHVLGTPPLLGREFDADEDVPHGARVTVLSQAFWQRAFEGDPSIVGQSILLRGEPYTVVGVMPAGFRSTAPADLWTPLRPSTGGEGSGANYGIAVRLDAASSWPRAEAEIEAIGRERYGPASEDGTSIQLGLQSMQAGLSAELRQPLLVLWGAVGLVLLLVCANVAGLLLARAGRRTREIATRMALGGGRLAVVRQLLVESVVLAALGGALGVALGQAGLIGLQRLGADAYGLWQPVRLDARILVVTAAVSLFTAVLFGLAPALAASRIDLQQALVEGGARGSSARATHWPRRLLVVGEVAIGVSLIVAAALLVRTFVNLSSLDPGIDARGVVAASASLQDARYETSDAMNQLFDGSLERIRALPGVEAAAVSLGLPYQRLLNLGFKALDTGEAEPETRITNLSYVTPEFFTALRLPVRNGRTFGTSDRVGTPLVVVVNESFVETYYPDRDPINTRIAIAGEEREIVGVVASAQQRPGWGEPHPLARVPVVYMPAAQTGDRFLQLVHTWFQPSWVVRSSAPVAVLRTGIRRAIEETDPRLPVADFRRLVDVEAGALSSQRFLMTLITALGGIALLLSVIGIHGLVANSVVERTRELGIRLALGATAAGAIRAVALPGVVLAFAGVVLGSAIAAAGTRALRSFLWGVSATDVPTFLLVAVGLLGVAAVASLLPALRVLAVDPASTLRHE